MPGPRQIGRDCKDIKFYVLRKIIFIFMAIKAS